MFLYNKILYEQLKTSISLLEVENLNLKLQIAQLNVDNSKQNKSMLCLIGALIDKGIITDIDTLNKIQSNLT